MSLQPHAFLTPCPACPDRFTSGDVCVTCEAQSDMKLMFEVGVDPVRFGDLLAVIEDAQSRCACGARIVNEGDAACTRCSMLDS